jgi:hypothetical protein
VGGAGRHAVSVRSDLFAGGRPLILRVAGALAGLANRSAERLVDR